MGIESKHAYRFGFLKSEEWRGIRIHALARFQGKCFICMKMDWSNDVHHIRYGDSWSKSDVKDLVPLCRECHEEVHSLMKQNPKIDPYQAILNITFARDPERVEKWRFFRMCKKVAPKIKKYLLTNSTLCITCPNSG